MLQIQLPLPDSYLVLCPWCGDCWARITGSDTTHWWHRYVPCEAHPQASSAYGWKLAGSLLDTDEPLLDLLSPELLTREFNLHIK